VPVEKSHATEFRLRVGQPALTAWEKSAEGILAEETSPAKQGGLTLGEGPNGARTEWYG